MKYLILILCAALTSACATRDGSTIATLDKPAATFGSAPLRTPETIKAYPVGRYVDPALPEVMHERHTLYRQEETPAWDTQGGQPYSLGLGPVARSNPSPSYYVAADLESRTAQQQAYAEALAEQNRALTERIDNLLRQQGETDQLREEIDRLRQQLEEIRMSPPFGNHETEDDADEDAPIQKPHDDGAFIDVGRLALFEDFAPTAQDSLLSQMSMHDELTRLHATMQLSRLPLFWTKANLHLIPFASP